MGITTYEGVVENGQIRLKSDVPLPESARVFIVIPDFEVREHVYVHSPRLARAEQAREFEMEVTLEAEDANTI